MLLGLGGFCAGQQTRFNPKLGLGQGKSTGLTLRTRVREWPVSRGLDWPVSSNGYVQRAWHAMHCHGMSVKAGPGPGPDVDLINSIVFTRHARSSSQ